MPDLPLVYTSGYVQARKQPNGKYKLYFTGTCNEVFPGELFRSPSEAKMYYRVQIEKRSNQL